MGKIRIAIAGVGNCASSLIQGIEYYKKTSDSTGLMHREIGGYTPADIEVVAAFDIDKRKVNRPLSEAIFAKPNCTKRIIDDLEGYDIKVKMGEILDGISEHMMDYPEDRRFIPSDEKPVDVANVLLESGAEILLNYLPVGSQRATEYYAEACLKTGVSFINCVPVFIASNKEWAERFRERNIPVIGDDIKSQIGATIIHRVLTKLFEDRGVTIDHTYQLNVGGNTDFLNMLNRSRLNSKKISKTEAVKSQMNGNIDNNNIHIGPSDYVPWLNDNKVCFIRMEGRIYGNVPINLELRLSVEDSPNSAGVVIDAIRCAKLARDKKIGGVLISPSAYFMKHPPHQFPDSVAKQMVEDFIAGRRTD